MAILWMLGSPSRISFSCGAYISTYSLVIQITSILSLLWSVAKPGSGERSFFFPIHRLCTILFLTRHIQRSALASV
jgi:hypothetical protein